MALTYVCRLSVFVAAPALWFLVATGAVAQSYAILPPPPFTALPPPPDAVPPPDAAPPSAAAEPATGEPEAGRHGTTSAPTHAVSLHAGPNGGTPIIGVLRAGVPVEILASASPGWLQVRSGTDEGWAWSAYFPPGAGANAPAGGAAAGPTGTSARPPATALSPEIINTLRSEITSP